MNDDKRAGFGSWESMTDEEREERAKASAEFVASSWCPIIVAAFGLRTATNGAADPWDPKYEERIVKAIETRLRLWAPESSRHSASAVDTAVKALLHAILAEREATLSAKVWSER